MNLALEEAVAWYARLQAPDCQPEERMRFELWLARDQRHADAWASVERFLVNLDTGLREDPGLRALTDEALAATTAIDSEDVAQPAPPTRRWLQMLPLAAAASILAGIVFVLQMGLRTAPTQTFSYDSPATEQRSLTLSDGSQTSLDIDSAITVNMSSDARDISLVKGRALFEVAHDRQRPFTVAAGSGRITALGTRFQVQHQNGQVIVTLTEGSVEVVNAIPGNTLRTRLLPGEQLRYAADSTLWSKTSVETDTVTSWSRGRHVFRNTRLADALEEVNRYAATSVRLADPLLGELTVSGNFMIGDSSRILAAFSAALPVRAEQNGDELLLFPADENQTALQPDRVQ